MQATQQSAEDILKQAREIAAGGTTPPPKSSGLDAAAILRQSLAIVGQTEEPAKLTPPVTTQPAQPAPGTSAAERAGLIRQVNPKTGQVTYITPKEFQGRTAGLGVPITAAREVGGGVVQAAGGAKQWLTGAGEGGRVQGALDVVEGGMRAGLPLLLEGLATAPIKTLTGLISGIGIGKATEKVAEATGADSRWSRLLADISGLVGGGLATHGVGKAGEIAKFARERRQTIDLRPDETGKVSAPADEPVRMTVTPTGDVVPVKAPTVVTPSPGLVERISKAKKAAKAKPVPKTTQEVLEEAQRIVNEPVDVSRGTSPGQIPAVWQDRFDSLAADARANGFEGTDAELATKFTEALDLAKSHAKDLHESINEGVTSPRELLSAIAKAGGLGIEAEADPGHVYSKGKLIGDGMVGELETMLDSLTTQGVGKTAAGRRLPQQFRRVGKLPGGEPNEHVIVRKGGMNIDAMREALSQDPRFKDVTGNIEDFVQAVDTAIRQETGAMEKPGLAKASVDSVLENVLGVTEGSKWWTPYANVPFEKLPVHEQTQRWLGQTWDDLGLSEMEQATLRQKPEVADAIKMIDSLQKEGAPANVLEEASTSFGRALAEDLSAKPAVDLSSIKTALEPGEEKRVVNRTNLDDVLGNQPEDSGIVPMTGERVRSRYGMEPKDAVKAGLVTKETNESFGTVYRVKNDTMKRVGSSSTVGEEKRVTSDILPTGEIQSRLPGSVGAVRDVEVPQPKVAEVPEQGFNLTAPPETKPKQGDIQELHGGLNAVGAWFAKFRKSFGEGWREGSEANKPIPTFTKARPTDLASAKQGVLMDDLQDLDRAGNIRMDKFDWPDEAKLEFKRMAAEADNYIAQRRGVQGWEATEELAQAIPKTKSVPEKGTAFNAEQLESLGGQIKAVRQQLDDVVAKVATGEYSPDDVVQQAVLQTKMQVLAETYAGATAEAGRALNILAKLRKAVESKDQALIDKALEFLGGKERMAEIAKMLAAFPKDDIIGKYRFVRSLNKPGVTDFLNWYWFTNLLSGPLTHARNIVGNLTNTLFSMGARPLSSLISGVKLYGDKEVSASEFSAMWDGMRHGYEEGAKKAGFMLRQGFSMDDVANTEFRPPEIPGGLATNFIGRSLEAADLFFRSINASMEMYAQAATAATKSGQVPGSKGWQLKRDAFLANPPKKAVEIMSREAARSVFRQGHDNPFIQGLAKAKQDRVLTIRGQQYKIFNPLKLVMPFVSTPANIMMASMEATPFGFLTAMTKASPREVQLAAGRAALGSLLLTPLAMMVAQGKVSGPGPKDPKFRDELKKTGWQARSVKIGDKWYEYSQIQPLALPLALMAQAHDSYVYDREEPNFGDIVQGSADAVMSQSFISGLSSFFDALSDDSGKKWETMMRRTATSLMPLSSLQGQTARAIDPVQRESDTLMKSILANTPGASFNVPARQDVFGEDMLRSHEPVTPATALEHLFSPVQVSQTKGTTLDKELVRLGKTVLVGYPAKDLTIQGKTIPLADDEYRRMVEASGGMLKRVLDQAVSGGAWKAMSDDAKASVIKKYTATIRDSVRETIIKPMVMERLKKEGVSGIR